MLAVRLLHGLAFIAGCGCQPTSPHLEDNSVLVQSQMQAVLPASGQVYLNDEAVKALWPDLDSLWNEVQDSVGDITKTVGEVTDNAVNRVDQLSQTIQAASTHLAMKIASALNHALEYIKSESDRLLFDTMQEKAAFFEQVQNAVATPNSTMVLQFKQAANKILVSAWGRWQTLKGLVDRSSEKICGGLKGAGQGWLASKVNLMINSAETNLDSFMKQLKEADDELQNLDEGDMAVVQQRLVKINTLLNKAMQQIPTFISKFQQAFQEITEKLCTALLLSSEDVDSAFATVAQNVTSIGWRLRSSGRELLLSMHRGIVLVSKAMNVTPPEWDPIPPPDAAYTNDDVPSTGWSWPWSAANGLKAPSLFLALLAATFLQ